MPHALIVYATTHGHTALIAARLASVLDDAGVEVRLHDVRAIPRDVAPRDYDAVVVAASVHGGRHQPEIAAWVADHRTTLAMRPTAFVSVSLSAAEDSAEARGDTRGCIDRFVEDTGWSPTVSLPVAGALRFSAYDLPTRVLMRLIAHRHGRDGAVLEDHDYTDWEALERFGRGFAARILHARELVRGA